MKSIFGTLFFLIALIFTTPEEVEQQKTKEEVHAALIFNITKYVNWENINGNFEIVVLNSTKTADELKKYYANRLIGGQKVTVLSLTGKKTLNYIGAEVIISDHEEIFAENCLSINTNGKNGVINFSTDSTGKIKILLKKGLADNAHLKISSQLLSIVEVID